MTTLRTSLRAVLAQGSPSNRLLRTGLAMLAIIASGAAVLDLLRHFPWGVDLEIPLRAAARWLAGDAPYVAQSFLAPPGYDLPFLYPPYVLPIVAPLTALPRLPLHVAWFVLNLALATWTCRRLGMPSRFIPIVLLWPPFSEALLAGNVQVAIMAAFVAVLVPGRAGRPATSTAEAPPTGWDPSVSWPRAVRPGILAAVTAGLKVSQPHVVVAALRRDPRVAITAIAIIIAMAVVTLPLTGVGLWFDWVDQLRRAADPAWELAGPSLGHVLPSPLGPVIVAAGLVAALWVPRQAPAVWLGILMVVGGASLHTYYLLFLLPAMLRLRREIALIAGMLIATYIEPAWWLAIATITVASLLARRSPDLLERQPASARA